MFCNNKERNVRLFGATDSVLGRKYFLFPITLYKVDPILGKRIEPRKGTKWSK